MKHKPMRPSLLGYVQFFYWAGTTVMVSFMVLFLRSEGYSDSEVGLITSLVAAGAMLLQPALGYLNDTIIPPRRLLIACLALSLPLSAAMPSLGRGLLLSGGIVLLCMCFEPQATLIDNYILRLGETKPDIDYGKARKWGPLGSAVAALLAGVAGWLWSLKLMYPLMFLFFAACLVCLWRCEEAPCPNKKSSAVEEQRGENDTVGFLGACRTLLKTPEFVLFIVCCSLFQFSMRTATTFLGLLVASRGGGSLELGLLLFVVYGAQMPFMLWAGRRINAGMSCEKLFLLALAFGTLRLFLFTIDLPFALMAVAQLIQAAQTGLYIRVFVQHITNITPPAIHATAASLGAAVSLGVGQIAGGVIHGQVIEQWGGNASAVLSGCVMAATFVLFFTVSRMIPPSKAAQAVKS